MEQGYFVSSGVAKGKLLVSNMTSDHIVKSTIEQVNQEIALVKNAVEFAIDEYQQLYKSACEQVGKAVAMILEGHRMMLEDDTINLEVIAVIHTKKVNAEWAVHQVYQEYANQMLRAKDPYLRARALDFMEVRNTLINTIDQCRHSIRCKASDKLEPVIVLGKSFGVAELFRLSKQGSIGFLDILGDEESHAVIVAKSLELPMMIQVNETFAIHEDKIVVMDSHDQSLRVE